MNRILMILSCIFLLLGCGSSPRREGALRPELLDFGGEHFLKGNYGVAAVHYGNYLTFNPLSTRRSWIYMRIGLCRNGEGEYRMAIEAFGQALAAGAVGSLRIEILYRRAISYNFNDMPDIAILDLEQVLAEPTSLREEVLKSAEFERMLGVTLIRAGEWKRGRRILENLIRAFPRSPEAIVAYRLLTFQKFSIQVARCPDHESAQKKITLLRAKGVSGRAEPLPDHSGISVLVGEFSRYDAVVRERKNLKSRGIEGFILP